MDALQKRKDAELAIYANVAKAYADAKALQAGRAVGDEQKEAAAVTLAVGGSTRANAMPAPRDVAAGREILEKAYGKDAESLASVLSGRVADYDLPKGFARTNDLNQLVRKGQNLADDLNADAYRNRGRVEAIGPNGHYLELTGRTSEAKEKLVQHMLNVKSAIEAQVDRKQLDRDGADMLYQRIQKETFSRETPGVSKDYVEFEKANGPRVAKDISAKVEARYSSLQTVVSKVSGKEAADAAKVAQGQQKAADFKQLPKEEVLKKHPDLSPAYQVMEAAQKVAAEKLSDDKARAAFLAQTKDQLAAKIEKNQPLPSVKVKEEYRQQQVQTPVRTQPERSSQGMER